MNKETFDFSEALRRMKEGKKVVRKAAVKKCIEYISLVKDGFYVKRKETDNLIYMLFSPKDILATDWEEVEG